VKDSDTFNRFWDNLSLLKTACVLAFSFFVFPILLKCFLIYKTNNHLTFLLSMFNFVLILLNIVF